MAPSHSLSCYLVIAVIGVGWALLAQMPTQQCRRPQRGRA